MYIKTSGWLSILLGMVAGLAHAQSPPKKKAEKVFEEVVIVESSNWKNHYTSYIKSLSKPSQRQQAYVIKDKATVAKLTTYKKKLDYVDYDYARSKQWTMLFVKQGDAEAHYFDFAPNIKKELGADFGEYVQGLLKSKATQQAYVYKLQISGQVSPSEVCKRMRGKRMLFLDKENDGRPMVKLEFDGKMQLTPSQKQADKNWRKALEKHLRKEVDTKVIPSLKKKYPITKATYYGGGGYETSQDVNYKVYFKHGTDLKNIYVDLMKLGCEIDTIIEATSYWGYLISPEKNLGQLKNTLPKKYTFIKSIHAY